MAWIPPSARGKVIDLNAMRRRATTKIAWVPTRWVLGESAESGIAGRPEHISPWQGFGRPGGSARSATAESPARSSDSRPIPTPFEGERIRTKWEEHSPRADPGMTTHQARNAPAQKVINRPGPDDFMITPRHLDRDRPSGTTVPERPVGGTCLMYGSEMLPKKYSCRSDVAMVDPSKRVGEPPGPAKYEERSARSAGYNFPG